MWGHSLEIFREDEHRDRGRVEFSAKEYNFPFMESFDADRADETVD